MIKNKTIYRLFNFHILEVVLVLFFLLLYIFVNKNLNAKSNFEILKASIIEKHKQTLIKEVDRILEISEFSKNETRQMINNAMKSNVITAHNVAYSIYNQFKNTKSNAEIQKLILETLRGLSYMDENLNISILSMDGRIILNPKDQRIENISYYNQIDDLGNYPIRDEIEFVKINIEGFFENRWNISIGNTNEFHDKTYYLKEFVPFGWIIRSSEFNSTIHALLKKNVINTLTNYNTLQNQDLFISGYDGKAILINSPDYKAGDYINQIKDSSNFEIFQEELKLIQNNGSGLMYYKWLGSNNLYYNALSCVAGIEDLELIIGLRSNLDIINLDVQQLRNSVIEQNTKSKIKIFIVLLIVALIITILSLEARKKLLSDFNLFKSLITTALINNKNIDFSSLSFYEFKQLAITTNSIFKASKSAKKELVRSEEKFKTIIENAPVMITSFDKRGKYNLWNKECVKMLQYDINEISKHPNPFSLFFSEEYEKMFKTHIAKADGVFRLYKFKLRDNSEAFQKWANFRLNNDDVISVGYDVTELIEKEKIVLENKTFLQELLNNLPSPVFFKNMNLEYEGCNNKYSEIIGKPEIAIIGKTIFDLVPEVQAKNHQKKDILLLESEKVQEYEDYLQLSNGKIRIYLVTKSVFYNENGEKAGIMGVMQDITKLKEAEKEIIKKQDNLKTLNITKDKLFSIISHDLKGPFNAILSLSKILYKRMDKLNKQEIQNYLEKLHSSSEQTYKLLDNLLQWSASQINSLEPKPEILNLPNLINESVSLLFDSAAEKEIAIINKIYDNYRLYVDYNMISSVFRNIISNAIKYTNKNGQILITAKKKSDFIEIIVTDNGIGMDQKTLNALFKIESMLQTKGTNDESGSGIGLTLSKELIQINNGSIHVASELNDGSTFTISLPSVD